jgi:hypothetical protein
MTRTLPFLLLATPAGAHPGHIETVAGHDHWVLGATLGALAAGAVIAWVKGRKSKEDAAEAEEVPEGDDAEARA